MRNSVRTLHASCVLGLWILSGCASILPPSPLAPFLVTDPADSKLVEALAHEQYTRVERCHERKSCPQDLYTRGLISLFQSRERALASFQEVRSAAPDSRLATLSTSWIDLLQASDSNLSFLNGQNTVPKVTEEFVWETLERELEGSNENLRRMFRDRGTRVGKLTDQASRQQNHATSARDKEPTNMEGLHKRLQERERTLAEREQQIQVLSSQLDALKRIEQDVRDRRRPVRPSAIVTP